MVTRFRLPLLRGFPPEASVSSPGVGPLPRRGIFLGGSPALKGGSKKPRQGRTGANWVFQMMQLLIAPETLRELCSGGRSNAAWT